jgi:hypothetical protein
MLARLYGAGQVMLSVCVKAIECGGRVYSSIAAPISTKPAVPEPCSKLIPLAFQSSRLPSVLWPSTDTRFFEEL